jgi:predicted metalloprotease
MASERSTDGDPIGDGAQSGNRIGVFVAVGGAVLVAVVAVAWFAGVRPSSLLRKPAVAAAAQPVALPNPTHDPLIDFASATLTSTAKTWQFVLAPTATQFVAPTVQLFDDSIPNACGMPQPATNSFYCPPSRTIYLDLGFLRALRDQMKGSSPDAAQAYVIAYEVGHHVQNLLGDTDRARMQQQSAPADEADRWQLRLDLQADCFAGLWAAHAEDAPRALKSDVDSVLAAVGAVARDRSQRYAEGHMIPDPLTNGSAAQRERWFKLGLKAETVEGCDTYHTQIL